MKFKIITILLICVLGVTAVNATENITTENQINSTHIENENIPTVYKDNNNTIQKTDDNMTQTNFKDNSESGENNLKQSVSITSKNLKTYYHSDTFFKAKILNKNTNNPLKDIKVIFNVYDSKNRCKSYYSTTNIYGEAVLKKNLKVGSYKIITGIKDKNIDFKKTKATLTVKETSEFGCCSFYLQLNKTSSIIGFRRDSTDSRNIHIVKEKINSKNIIKQYKKGGYFFHTMTSEDGWMASTGGMDSTKINTAIEKLASKMFKSGSIKKSYLKKIQNYKKKYNMGHFAIKAPNGKYAAVWCNGIYQGKLKAGEYISIPNKKTYFRYGLYNKFDENPIKAAVKIGATDQYGINRRDITVYHWKATTIEGETTSKLTVYGSNDNGKLVGRNTAHLKDNIYFKGKFISKNTLPISAEYKKLGKHNFGNIDKIIKTKTTVKAPGIITGKNESKALKITVKNKKSKKAIKNIILKLKINNTIYSIKTDNNGLARFNTSLLNTGFYNVKIYTDNIKYLILSKTTLMIKE